MTPRRFLLPLFLFAALMVPGLNAAEPAARPPNFVIIFLDDSGWADFRPFGETPYPTPNVEKLAQGGCRFNQFRVPQAVCSASRSALMTGCNPGRSKVFGAHPPRARGLDPKFATLAEVLKPQGYQTAVFGKWHLGDQPETRPPARGFDESCGLMYSNDMWKHHPETRGFDKWPLQFWDNGKITIDGMNVWDLITGKADAVNPHDFYPFSTGNELEGVISGDGRWKLHLPHPYRTLAAAGKDGMPGTYAQKRVELSLFDLQNDANETTNLLDKHPDIAAKLQGYAEAHKSMFHAPPH